MESLYGAGMDPTPYFWLAYGAGSLGLLSFAAWVLRDRARLRLLLSTLATPRSNNKL